MNKLEKFEQERMKKEFPEIRPGDNVLVYQRIKEGDKERTQIFEGTVIKLKRRGPRSSITVRKVSYGVGVEKVFPLYSPILEKIEVKQKGKVRRAKLFYLRERIGKSAKIKELR
jgi:large subunit ribosomal protein L19